MKQFSDKIISIVKILAVLLVSFSIGMMLGDTHGARRQKEIAFASAVLKINYCTKDILLNVDNIYFTDVLSETDAYLNYLECHNRYFTTHCDEPYDLYVKGCELVDACNDVVNLILSDSVKITRQGEYKILYGSFKLNYLDDMPKNMWW